eukprot:SAG31_NODE_1270_length_9065_cov_7.007473_8_plen_103_part_00
MSKIDEGLGPRMHHVRHRVHLLLFLHFYYSSGWSHFKNLVPVDLLPGPRTKFKFSTGASVSAIRSPPDTQFSINGVPVHALLDLNLVLTQQYGKALVFVKKT